MAAAFSRLQLAAALLEYDNDPDDPSKPTRSAQESAIFANFRRNPRSYPPPTAIQTDYLGVSIDGEEHGVLPGDNPRISRASALSINTIRNPFGIDDQITEEGPQDEELEVDLASWGLDSLMPKGKSSAKGKQKAAQSVRSQPIQSQVPSHQPVASREQGLQAPKRAFSQSRSLSVGGTLELFGTERPPAQRGLDNRRRSTGSPLDVEDIQGLPPIQRRRASSYTVLENQRERLAEGQGVPFPTISVRSTSPNRNNVARQADQESVFDTEFGAYPRDPQRPVHAKQRTTSNATMTTSFINEENPFAIRPPSVTSRFDPKAVVHPRTMSNASLGSRILLEQDNMSVAPTDPVAQERERRYSTTLDLLRPKVLVMPSPLQGTTPAPPPRPEAVRDGFEVSTDGPPLPPGARSSRRASQMYLPTEPPASASNLFTPNPTVSMSLSQMTFRNTLRVDGVGSAASLGGLPRATEEGEQVRLEEEEEEEVPELPAAVSEEMLAVPAPASRPPGKLYGKSLMDDLEERKAQMKNKSRTFYGDNRPTMMARNSYRSSTLIDPATLQDKPTLNRSGPSGFNNAPNLNRRNSSNIKPLLNFDDETKQAGPSNRASNLPPTRSVFGVDTLWEREMSKLKDIETREKVEEELRIKREEDEEARKKKRKGRKGTTEDGVDTPPEMLPVRPSETRVSMEPPVLPDIPKTQRRAPPVDDNDSESEQSDNDHPQSMVEPDWHASSDEEVGPATSKLRGLKVLNDDDDDMPLSAAQLQRSHLRAQDDSDDERPLSFVMEGKRGTHGLSQLGNEDEDEDEKPLGLRYSTMMSSSGRAPTNNEDDDRPLGLHPEQQRRSQYNQILAANAQMQQMQMNQQLFLQAQMQQQTYFPQPPMMGGPFFGPPTMSMAMQPPIHIPPPSPPPMQDPVKIGRIDSWRQNVAIEGDT